MAGATIFVMYADGKGNVTISGRDGGQGHVEPELDSALMGGVTLLEGSGVNGSVMTANVRCAYNIPPIFLDEERKETDEVEQAQHAPSPPPQTPHPPPGSQPGTNPQASTPTMPEQKSRCTAAMTTANSRSISPKLL